MTLIGVIALLWFLVLYYVAARFCQKAPTLPLPVRPFTPPYGRDAWLETGDEDDAYDPIAFDQEIERMLTTTRYASLRGRRP